MDSQKTQTSEAAMPKATNIDVPGLSETALGSFSSKVTVLRPFSDLERAVTEATRKKKFGHELKNVVFVPNRNSSGCLLSFCQFLRQGSHS